MFFWGTRRSYSAGVLVYLLYARAVSSLLVISAIETFDGVFGPFCFPTCFLFVHEVEVLFLKKRAFENK